MVVVITIPSDTLLLLLLHLKDKRLYRNIHRCRDKRQLMLGWWEWDMMSFPTKGGRQGRIQNQGAGRKIKTSFQNSLHPTITITRMQLHSFLWTCMNLQIIRQLHFQKQEDTTIQTILYNFSFGFAGATTHLNETQQPGEGNIPRSCFHSSKSTIKQGLNKDLNK